MTQRLACHLIEIKFDPGPTDQMSFTGHGAVFSNVDAYGDTIVPGAFKQFLSDVKDGKQSWPAMLSQHGGWGLTADDLTPVGVWTDLSEDDHGLKVHGVLADTPRGRELHTLMKMTPRPAIDGLSIGYVTRDSEPVGKSGDGRRRLKQIDLVEISPVTFPANLQARVASVKSIEDLATVREIEDYLSEFGLSKKQTVALIAKIKGTGSGDPVGAPGGPGDPVADMLLRSLQRRSVPTLPY